MMTFDQVMNSYAAYVGAREVSDEVEWKEQEDKEDEGGSVGKAD